MLPSIARRVNPNTTAKSFYGKPCGTDHLGVLEFLECNNHVIPLSFLGVPDKVRTPQHPAKGNVGGPKNKTLDGKKESRVSARFPARRVAFICVKSYVCLVFLSRTIFYVLVS